MKTRIMPRFLMLALVCGSGLMLTGRVTAQPATPGYALQLDGSTGYVTTFETFSDPQSFTVSIWFKTTTTQGGKLVGYGDASTGPSGNYDRNLYMDNQGHIVFGVNPGPIEVISNMVPCNDGNWHQAVGTLSAVTGLSLYIDGVLVSNNPAFNAAQNFDGVWKIGYDNLNNWPDLPASYFFNGTVDEVQIWGTALSAGDIAANFHRFLAVPVVLKIF
ncbi:MAG TPA: LamG domain-containing protein [Candidatus Paceibacterota bacterium]|nr:LamG domain-containing protein [Candidatus Paceibacterota bacterium]